jgi:hypothetical protein
MTFNPQDRWGLAEEPDKLAQAREHMAAMHDHGMKASRIVDELHKTRSHHMLMLALMQVDDAEDSLENEEAERKWAQDSYDLDLINERRREQRDEKLDLQAEREHLRLVGADE